MTLMAVVTCAALLGSIAGRVTDADSGAPIAGARITISGPGITAAANPLVTDGDGRFRREGLAPGRYQLSAAARGYATASGRWRESIVLDAGEAYREASFRLHRGAVLAGFISDDYGEPIANLTVALIESPEPPSRTVRLDALHTAVTDDRGYYRFWGLRAGRYLVSARPSVAELAAARAEVSPAASFYPGVHAPSQAEPIAVPAAAEVDGINFSVKSGRLSRLSIRVVDANGHASPEASVSVSDVGAGRIHAISGFPTGVPGHFVSPQMPPGDYEIVAVTGRSAAAVSYARQPVTIAGDGAEVTVELSTSPAARLSGHVAAAKDASPWSSQALAVSSEAASDGEPRFVPGADAADPFSGAVRADGGFSTAVLPGRRTIRVNGLPPGWSILSITLNGRDAVDREVLFSPGDTVTNTRIVVTDRLKVVTGTVADADEGATAVIFSRDRTQWTPGTRSILRSAIDQQGRFRISGVRPGDYFAAAVPREPSEQVLDPMFLDTLAATAMLLKVGTGNPQPIALTVTRSAP